MRRSMKSSLVLTLSINKESLGLYITVFKQVMVASPEVI